MREGDIEALRNKMKDMGRPIKSNTVITKGGEQVHYSVDDKGRIKIKDTGSSGD